MDYFERHLAAADSPAGGGSMSAAEWMTDVVVSADRSGRAGECAERFLASELSARSVARIGELVAEQGASPRPELAAQLAVRRDTVTPAWFALKTLLKVRAVVGPAALDPIPADWPSWLGMLMSLRSS